MPAASPTLPDGRQGGLGTAFAAGVVVGLPFLIVLVPFGLVFGVAAVKAGLDFWQVVGFSTVVLAGASQIIALQLMVEQAPLLIILISALAVNLRLAMYSAALVPWFGQASLGLRAAIAYALIDQTFALSLKQFEDNPRMTLGQRAAYFFGSALVLAATWPVFTGLGASLGQAIPPEYALDFAVPIAFLSMIAPGLRSVPHLVTAVVAFTLAALLRGLPYGTGLLIASIVAMIVGAEVERRRTTRAQAQA